MIVVDTSALIEFFLGSGPSASIVRGRMRNEVIAAPHGIDLECASTLRGLTAGSKLDADLALSVLMTLSRLDLRRYPTAPLLPRIWALRHNMGSYDAAFVALAERLDVPLVTTDAKFARTPGLDCVIDTID